MKRILYFYFSIFLLATLLTGCTNASINAQNTIAPTTLTKDQTELLEAISQNTQEYLLFDYNTTEKYTRKEFWVEVYKDGVLIDKVMEFPSYADEPITFKGQLIVSINQTPDYVWTMRIHKKGTNIDFPSYSISDYGISGRAYGPINNAVKIEDGKEIVLYSSVFSDGPLRTNEDIQLFIEQPAILKDYAYVHLLKCKFSK